jgi:hypothetical protein
MISAILYLDGTQKTKKMKRLIIYAFCLLGTIHLSQAQTKENVLTPEMLSMPRSQMTLENDQLFLFNGRGSVSPCELSITGLDRIRFLPRELGNYNFHFNFFDKLSGTIIYDDAKHLETLGLNGVGPLDPNGANFRSNIPKMMIPQDDIWQPNQSYRKGIYHYKLKENWVSMGVETWTSVSGSEDEALQKIRIVNRAAGELEIFLVPIQTANRRLSDIKDMPREDNGIFSVTSRNTRVSIASDISESDARGFRVSLPAGGVGVYYFAIQVTDTSENQPERHQPNIKERFITAQERTVERLNLMADRLPKIKTDNESINEMYRRCILTVSECKWERDEFVVSPFWATGSWIISMIWDQCFAEEVIAMVDPEGLKKAIMLTLRESKMERSYIAWYGAQGGILYIQDPFALQTMIQAYITYTGDRSILNEVTGDATVYEWLERWIYKLHDEFARADGLLDVEDPEHLIEIRTGGYNRVVPVVSGLASDFYLQMSQWASEQGDKDAAKFKEWHEQIKKSLAEKSWNDEIGWFDNLYPDGGRSTTMTFHLLDLIESNSISTYQKSRMIEHIRDGEFLAPYGMWSISRADSIHWDRMDADFGGGGQYTGMTLRIAKNLYLNGHPEKGYEILKRYSKYAEHFPVMPGNPWSDKMFQNRVSLSFHIASGAGIEAIMSGIFGVWPREDGKIEFNPYYHSDLGNADLTDFQFRGDSYDVNLREDHYLVKKNGTSVARRMYGEKFLLEESR